jgi:hypothetical protein
VPRGFIEFAADDSMSYFNPALSKDKTLWLLCGADWQAALAGKMPKKYATPRYSISVALANGKTLVDR